MTQKKHGHGEKTMFRLRSMSNQLILFRRSLNLIECLLRIADTGLYPIVLEIFKHGIQRSGELIFLGLLQLHVSFCRFFNPIKNDVYVDHLDDVETRIITTDNTNISCHESERQSTS